MRGRLLVLLSIALGACGEMGPSTEPTASTELGPNNRPAKPGASNIIIATLDFDIAMDVDEQGRIAGFSQSASGMTSRFWTPATPRGLTGSTATLPGLGGDALASGLNEGQQIAGWASDGTLGRAVLWDGGILRALGEPAGGSWSTAEDLSDEPVGGGPRWVVGSTTLGSSTQPMVWRVSGTGSTFSVVDLEPLPAPAGGYAYAANASGLVVGDACLTSSDQPCPAKWVETTGGWQSTTLALVEGMTYGQALDVNASGTVVGYNSAGVSCSQRAVVWPAGSTVPIELPGLGCGISWAGAVNDAGQITGFASDAHGQFQAALWLPRSGGGYSLLLLGRPKGARDSEGRGLNEPAADGSGGFALEVVGFSSAPSGPHGTIWKVKLP
jgi:hypothetical protein